MRSGERGPRGAARQRRRLAPVPCAAAIALFAGLAASPAGGAVDGSPHDLVSQGYMAPRTGTARDKCTPCHLVDVDRELFSEPPPSLRGSYGAAALVCFSCHDGTTLVAPEVDASVTAFHSAGHRGVATDLLSPQRQEGGPGDADGGGAECATCHNPHESRHRPFLRAPLATICVSCHTVFNEAGTGARNLTGSHPVGIDPAAAARKEAPVTIAGAFRVPFPSAYPLQMGRGTTGTHWNLGGHLAAGGEGAIGCVTCHAVHGNEGAPPAPKLLPVEPARLVADFFCEGCHRGRRGDGVESAAAPNPGGTVTGRTYHPCDDDNANGPGRIVEIRAPAGWPFGAGEPPRLLCTSCHAPHRARPGMQLLRPAVAATDFCAECHDRPPSETHHPTGVSEGACASRLPSAASGGTPELTCELCHRAHNAGLGAARESDHVPLLRVGLAGNDLCVTCHPAEDPVCSTQTDHRASHFLGDPTLPETFGNPEPPLRLDPWPESGLRSRYGGENAKAVLCLSCHAFQKGALVSGDDGTARFLLARSGNPVEWPPDGEAVYLCTGCHGAAPGTGHGEKGKTHPLMDAKIPALGNEVSAPLSATNSGHMNCDSCHRSHGAHTASGVYILEVVEGKNADPAAIKPEIIFTPVCRGCHGEGKY